MKQVEDYFQDLLEQVEFGEPIDTLFEGLPDDEAELIQLTSTLRSFAFPAEDAFVVAEQEAQFIDAAQQLFPPQANAHAQRLTLQAIFENGLDYAQNRFDSIIQNRRLAAATFALIIAFVFSLGLWLGTGPAEESPAIVSEEPVQQDTAEQVVEIEQLPPASQNGEPQEVVDVVPTANEPAFTLVDAPVQPIPEKNQAVFLPILGNPLEETATTAVINDITGLVEVQKSENSWEAIHQTATLAEGERVRTGAFSQATLTFFDGSQAIIHGDSEISIDQLNALKPEQGYRTVVMTQWLGESEHHVQFRNDGGSRYEVKSPTGTGIARGTIFRVLVTPDKLAQYIVTEGKVDVSQNNQKVSVLGGQLTSFMADQPPAPASFFIEGSGEVESIGTTWIVGGRSFETNEQTIIVGNPQMGDLAKVEGFLLDGGKQMATRIILKQRAVVSRFDISGTVIQLGDVWNVAGQEVTTNDATLISKRIIVGDQVTVSGIILPDGRFLAEKISEHLPDLGLPFTFGGVIEQMASHQWVVSGQIIRLAAETTIPSTVSIGSIVHVNGWIIDSEWVAESINLEPDQLITFDFQGEVQQTGSWNVGGIHFEVEDWTNIDPSLAIGDTVQVRGVILANGTRVAHTIRLVEQQAAESVTFLGVVSSIQPWIINGLPVQPDDSTIISNEITVGARVEVKALLQPDGDWQILQISLINPVLGIGCFTLYSPITVVNAGSIEVAHWSTEILPNNLTGSDSQPKVDDIVKIPVCTNWDGTVIFTGEIVLIYRPIVIIITPPASNPIPAGCKVTPKGKIKCSKKTTKQSRRS